MVLGGGLALGVRSDLPLAAEAHLGVILLPLHRGLLVLLDGPPVSWLLADPEPASYRLTRGPSTCCSIFPFLPVQ